jgi:beta-glucuronidase
VSHNVYSGWYDDKPVAEAWDAVRDYADAHGGKGKPSIISEFGAAGLYGFHDPARVKWSEERQADILEGSIAEYARRPEIVGLFVWQFADCRVCEEAFYARPRCRNNKGLLDEYRRPKLAFEAVKRAYARCGARDEA